MITLGVCIIRYCRAPEQIAAPTGSSGEDKHRATKQADIWAWACTLLHMITGQPPWGTLNFPQIMFKVCGGNGSRADARGSVKLPPSCFATHPAEYAFGHQCQSVLNALVQVAVLTLPCDSHV